MILDLMGQSLSNIKGDCNDGDPDTSQKLKLEKKAKIIQSDPLKKVRGQS